MRNTGTATRVAEKVRLHALVVTALLAGCATEDYPPPKGRAPEGTVELPASGMIGNSARAMRVGGAARVPADDVPSADEMVPRGGDWRPGPPFGSGGAGPAGPSPEPPIPGLPPLGAIRRLYAEDADTMDGVVDRICVDTTLHVGAIRVDVTGRIGGVREASWDAAWGDSTEGQWAAESRGLRRWCFSGIETTARERLGITYRVETADAPGGAARDRMDGMVSCTETPSRHVGLDGRGGALALDLDGRPRAVTATRRGLRYHEWTGTRWREEWFHCLGDEDGTPAGAEGCPAEADWGHDYGLEAGIVIDWAQRPVVCFVQGERTLLEEEVFGSRTRYAGPATPVADARGTAYLAWRTAGGWKTQALGRVGLAGLWGCSIAALDPRPGREEYLVSWVEEVEGPHGTPVTWPHLARVIGPERWDGDFRVTTPEKVPPIWRGRVLCQTDEVCGSSRCTRGLDEPVGRCLVSEAAPSAGTEDRLASHFTSVAGVLTEDADRFVMAFDTAGGRIWLAEFRGPGCACEVAGSTCCRTSVGTPVVLGPSPKPSEDDGFTGRSGLIDPRDYGLRPRLALSGSRNGIANVAISFSAKRRDDHGRTTGGDEVGWTPAVMRPWTPSDAMLGDWESAAWWRVQVHEDLLTRRSGVARLFTGVHRLEEVGLPTWIGFRRDGNLRLAFGVDGRIVPADERNVIAAGPVQGVFAGWLYRDGTVAESPEFPSYGMVEGVVHAHLGLAAALNPGGRMRLLFHNTMSPIALGSARPADGDPPDWDLRFLGSASYFEEDSGTQFGTPMWGSSRPPCWDPDSCEPWTEPPPPALPRVVARCKDDRFFETDGEAAVSDAEISLTPSLTPAFARLAGTGARNLDGLKAAVFGGDPEAICGGAAGDGVLHDLMAVLGEEARDLFCDGAGARPPMWLDRVAYGLRHAAHVVWRFERGGSFPEPAPAHWPTGARPGEPNLLRTPAEPVPAASFTRVVPPGTSLPSFLASSLRIENDRPLLRDAQNHVCVNDGTTRRTTSIQVPAEPRAEQTVYRAEVPTIEFETLTQFQAAPPGERFGYDGSRESFDEYCATATRSIGFRTPVFGTEHPFAAGARVVVARVVNCASSPGARPEPTCVGCPGDAVISDSGMCHGCKAIVEEGVRALLWPAGLRAHIPGWGSTGRACVSAKAPTTGIAADTELEEKPSRGRFELDSEGGIWHACPGGPETAPTIRFHCISDDQCKSRGDAYRDWRCSDAVCRPPVYCASDDECAEGYACLDGSDWGITAAICRRPVPCVEYVGGICAPEGNCRGRQCEELVLGCPLPPLVQVSGGGASCTLDTAGERRICTNLRPLQFNRHEYACVETAAVTCPGDRYCSPGSGQPQLQCPAGSTCEAEPSGGTPWCVARELLNDAAYIGVVHAKPIIVGVGDRGVLQSLMSLTSGPGPGEPPESANIKTHVLLDGLYQMLNEDVLRWAMEDLGAALTIPAPAGKTFDETLLVPEIFWRELRLADGTAVQGELVVAIGQDEGGFDVESGGCSGRIMNSPWRLQVCAQPHYHDGRLIWRMQRKILVDPGTGLAPPRETSCSGCIDEELASGRDQLDGALDAFAVLFEPFAGLLWSLAAEEMSAPLVFGNWALFEALDRLKHFATRVPPITGDGRPDEVIGIRILDGKASVRALERRP